MCKMTILPLVIFVFFLIFLSRPFDRPRFPPQSAAISLYFLLHLLPFFSCTLAALDFDDSMEEIEMGVDGEFNMASWKAVRLWGATHWVMRRAPGLCAEGLTSMHVAM
uniref:Uncharacterized protein n=1 Tax=Ananas comosus var. bracteatus TaxID=296719 RepID=A0A6V7QJN2_ANACO|nr:unnamed protein product [Ananas comosus var. bracteatus]